jgi:hypothetical protein
MEQRSIPAVAVFTRPAPSAADWFTPLKAIG